MKTAIKFKELSVWLKTAIIGGWVSIIINGSAFIIGFIQGLIEL